MYHGFHTTKIYGYTPKGCTLNLVVYGILDRTWAFVKKLPLEDRNMLFEQIAEIKDGTCSQGRTTRIFQIYYSFF